MRVHISVPVSNLSASIGFYQSLFGQPASKRRADYANFRLDEPGLHLALMASDVPPPAGDRHFGVELFDHDTLAAWQERATSAGLQLRIEEQISCCYALADKFWATDPDGNAWEFWVRTGESDDLAPPTREEQTKSNCCPSSSD